MNEVDHITQQNAAMVEESSAAARMLSDESQRMAQLVANFHIEMPDARHGSALVAQARNSSWQQRSAAA